MRVSEDRMKTAIIAVKWPIPVCFVHCTGVVVACLGLPCSVLPGLLF